MSNKKKDELLGMPHGTASGKLRKSIIFELARRLDMLSCYRCQQEIIGVDDLSIEHKRAWQQDNDPKQAFFDLDNIAFSHLTCNIKVSTKPNKIEIPDGFAWCWSCKTLFNSDTKRLPCGDIKICSSCSAKKKAEWRERTQKH